MFWGQYSLRTKDIKLLRITLNMMSVLMSCLVRYLPGWIQRASTRRVVMIVRMVMLPSNQLDMPTVSPSHTSG